MFSTDRIISKILSDLPALEQYHIPGPAQKPVANVPKTRLADNQTIENGRVWTWADPQQTGPTVAFEGVATDRVVLSGDLDRFDYQTLGERFGVDDRGRLKCDELQAAQIKKMRFGEGLSIDDIVQAKTVNGKVERGWSRANVAKFSGAFTDAATLREEAK